MAIVPPQVVIDSIYEPTTEITRRIEIREQDAETIWHPEPGLVSGSVEIESSRDDRRSFSATLDNTDGSLDNHPDGLWYDKIVVPYRGIAYWENYDGAVTVDSLEPILWLRYAEPMEMGVRNHGSADVQGNIMGQVVTRSDGAFIGDDTSSSMNFSGGHIELSNGNLLDVRRKFTFKTWFRTMHTGEQTIYAAYDHQSDDDGIKIVLNFNDVPNMILVDDGSIPHVLELTDTVLDGNWHQFVFVEGQSKCRMYIDNKTRYEASSPAFPRPARFELDAWIGDDPANPSPFMGDLDETAIFNYDLTADSINRLYGTARGVTFRDRRTWECPLGSYMIDDIGSDSFPHQVSLSGRDLTKRLLLSKFKVATTFTKGMPIEELVWTIATNGGIDKFILPTTDRKTGKSFYFDRGVERSAALHDIGIDYGYEIYFDAEGYLRMTEPVDPTTSPVVMTFKTGEGGNLASYSKKSRDTRIYNVIVVTGESTETAPVWAIAENRSPSSPTRIATPGQPGGLSERVYQYTSSFITTVAQAQNTADNFLKVHALEEFEVSMGSIVFPWLDAGSVVEFIDPDPNPGDPTRFLLTSLSIPLMLEPMSASGKRVTQVG